MSCITILNYQKHNFAICTHNHEVIPRRELNQHVAKCTGIKQELENSSIINDDTSPIMTLQRLFQTQVQEWKNSNNKSIPLLPSVSVLNNNHNNKNQDTTRSVCKLCLQENNQVQYTKTASDRLAHLESFHSKLYATYGANIKDLTARYRQRVRKGSEDDEVKMKKKEWEDGLKVIDEEVERLYFETVWLVLLRDFGGLGDYVQFPTLVN